MKPITLNLLPLLMVSALSAGHLDDIGYTSLQARLGASTPDGAGLAVVQTEANESPTGFEYAPNTALAAFSGITFELENGPGDTYSSHATNAGQHIYGSYSVGTGITRVKCFDTGLWLNSGFLNTTTGFIHSEPEVLNGIIAQNHSWAGTTGDTALDEQILRRLDFAIDRDGFLAVAGLSNSTGDPLPNLLSQAYNGLTVGQSNGIHSRGLTTIDGAGRSKPDLVSPANWNATSWATGVVTGAVAMMREVGDGLGTSGSSDPRTLKAVLMAGATKEEFPSWSRSSSNPLDNIYGAGELNVENSYDILSGGGQSPYESSSSNVPNRAWSYDSMSPGNDDTFRFHVPRGKVLAEVSAILTWHREVTLPYTGLTIPASLGNLDLTWWSLTNDTLDTQLDSSTSTVDNVEHIWQSSPLGPGDYALAVSQATGSATPYSLAWRSELRAPRAYSEFVTAYLSEASSGDQLNTADPDTDLIDNLLEYATGLDPEVPNRPQDVAQGSSDGREITFQWRPSATDLGYTVAVSTGLSSSWDTSMTQVELISTVTIDDDLEELTYRLKDTMTASKVFLRLEVTAL